MDHYPPSTPLLENCPPGSDSMQRLVVHLDLFSGIGGFALAAQMVGGIKTVGFCEIDPWAQRVLAKNFPTVPICEDVKQLDPKNYGTIDLITGGYPCQPFSAAGERRGEEDARHLWPEMRRIIEAARPRWVLAENVAGHISMGLDEVLADLDAIGYAATATVIPACAVGAIHRRDRVWITAHDSRLGIPWDIEAKIPRLESLQGGEDGGRLAPLRDMPSLPASGLCRASDGIPRRVDRLRGLGNAIVPQVAAEILRCMMRVDSLHNSGASSAPKT
jgi:DNA (cytosine-5)-methyltransferase 1